MGNRRGFSRRETQIMDVLYASEGATVSEICKAIPDPPTDMSIRRLVHILVEKGHVKRRKRGREILYLPKTSRKQAGISALSHVIQTFFGGSVEDALAAHLTSNEKLSEQQIKRLNKMVEEAREKGL